MKKLRFFLIAIYIVIIILLLIGLKRCCKEKEVDRDEPVEEEVIKEEEEEDIKEEEEEEDVVIKEKFSAEVVMCIDCTGSMQNILGTIKSHAMNFYADIRRKCRQHGKDINSMRIKVIGFRDYTDPTPLSISPFFSMPDQEANFKNYISSLAIENGGDDPEIGYDALARAMMSEWSSYPQTRRVIVLWTDAPSHPLRVVTGDIASFDDMTKCWKTRFKADGKRLFLFAPNIPSWTVIESNWDHTVRHDVNLGGGLSDLDYEEIIKTLSESI